MMGEMMSRIDRGRHFLDRSAVEKISTGNQNIKVYKPGDGACADPWVWTYLAACLATFLGYDEAREVVKMVRYGEAGS
jgi:hypothetical protein